jgi:1-deoxy-D-xylulose-5-phosphate reductoisomerase
VIVETVLDSLGAPAVPDLAAVLALDGAAREAASRLTAAQAA